MDQLESMGNGGPVALSSFEASHVNQTRKTEHLIRFSFERGFAANVNRLMSPMVRRAAIEMVFIH